MEIFKISLLLSMNEFHLYLHLTFEMFHQFKLNQGFQSTRKLWISLISGILHNLSDNQPNHHPLKVSNEILQFSSEKSTLIQV
jgi:hypothetical protein